MRVVVIGGTGFIGGRVAQRLHERGDAVLVVHRGTGRPGPKPSVEHLLCARHELPDQDGALRDFAPDAVVDAYALTAQDVDTVPSRLTDLPAVVLSSQDVYEAVVGLRTGRHVAAVPLHEDSPLRTERYPYRGMDVPGVPDDYDKLDVEERWLVHGATVLRLPLVYGPYDAQRREEPLLRRVRAGRARIPVGAGDLLWTRAHVDDVADAVLAALDTDAARGRAVNVGERDHHPLRWWFERIVRATGSGAELVRVPDDRLPADLALSAASPQHMLSSVDLARQLLGWEARDPERRIAESVAWHVAHPPEGQTWTKDDSATDDAALAG